MEETGELLFLLSSADRIKLLHALRGQRLRLSSLASRLSMTVQETSRQIARLQRARLLERDSRGLYTLTGLGRIALNLLPSFNFIASSAEYLLSHNLSSLPSEFIERMGELSDSEYGANLGIVLDHFREVLIESREYVWLMADQILLQDSVAEKVLSDDAVPMRIIIPRAAAKEQASTTVPDELRGRIELCLIDEVRVGIALNERLAGVVFPDTVGKLDFDSGFRGQSAVFHGWCADLFEHHWNRGRRIA